MKEKSAVYIAIRDDTLDRKIADYINASNDPLRLTKLFLREREGVYQFGSKRVYVKMENDKVFRKPLLNISESRRRLPDLGGVPANQRADRAREDGAEGPGACAQQEHR
jgi:hypothetical protein